ncbi:MAG TPA: hypothetical protein VF618_26775 [Thermoanaerobaculia bacterium]
MNKKVNRIVWGLGLGYFVAYAPYAGLTKAMTSGRLGVTTDGLTLLPSAIAGTAVVLPLFILLSGWWRHARVPGLPVVISGIGTAIIIATTTLAYTFHGVSILFALLLLRGGVLVLAPVVDLACGRRVRWFSSVALVISIGAVLLTMFATDDRRFTTIALINTMAYLAGYAMRLPQMTLMAKVEAKEPTRRYFVEESLIALAVLILGPLLGAAFGVEGLRQGLLALTSGSAVANIGFVIGALYASLFIFGTLIYLDRRENCFCVPLNRGASLMAGVVATFVLGEAATWFELTSVGMILVAFGFLSPLHHIPEWMAAAAWRRIRGLA